jgi:tripartite ATP-independent transporter DctP family solute receptor
MPFAAAASNDAKKPTYILRFGHVNTDKDPYSGAFLDWAEQVAIKTKGDVKIEVYPSSQLGVEEDAIEQMRQGANIGWNSDAARLGNYVKDIAVMNAPYFVESLDEVQKLLSSKIIAGLEKQLAEKAGIKVLSFAYVQGFRNILAHKPIRNPKDASGLVFRSPGAPIWMESVRSLGVSPIAMPKSEVYSALQTKNIDGVDDTYTSAYAQSVYEVVKYISETQHILLMNFSICSAEWFNKLPPEYQKIVKEEADVAGMRVSREIQKINADAKQKIAASGVQIIPHSEIDVKAFRESGIKAYEKLNLLEIRDKIYAEIGKK